MWGRIIVLLILILVLAGGGLVWFDYLNVIDAKTALAPVLRLVGREPRTSGELGPDDFINLDAERLAVILEAQSLRELDMDRREEEIAAKDAEVNQKAQDLEERQKALEDQEKSINEARENAENVSRNVEGISQSLTNMPPERAVAIITEMNDQLAISVLRKTEELAQQNGTASLVPTWLMLMAATREGAAKAAELQRKMAAGAL
ncbi:MAG: flagellar protein FlbB [Treponema sp.]|nr:flagellar protein FlbB [Treponema sp.]